MKRLNNRHDVLEAALLLLLLLLYRYYIIVKCSCGLERKRPSGSGSVLVAAWAICMGFDYVSE